MAYKHDYDKILTRLTTILSRLNSGESLAVSELSVEFDVSARTIQRDFSQRLVNLYPIYQEGKKWKMQEDFKLEKTTTIENRIVLDIINSFAKGVGDDFYSKAKAILDKIRNENASPIYVKVDMEDISSKLYEIELLEKAIKSKHIIEANYEKEDSSKQICVKPLKIVNFEGFWYLMALDTNSNDGQRTYYLKNISNVKVKKETFQTSLELDKLLKNSISIWFDKDVKPFEVRLYISNIISKYLKRKPISPTQKIIKEYEDGSCELSLQITNEMEILPIVKYWLPHMKILEPKELQKDFINELKEYIKLESAN